MSAYQSVQFAVSDTWAITKRNLLKYLRLPQLVFFSSIQPIMFLTLFNFVFGGALGGATQVPGGKYINFLLPGILAQTVLFGAMQTGIGLAEDMSKGIIDRFRSLPMNPGAVMAGRTISDAIRNITVAIIMITVGSFYGFRFQAGTLKAFGMVALVVLFGFAVSWAAAFLGMSAKDSETAQLGSFLFIFPLTFASAAFVPVQSMPSWLQKFAANQPITHLVTAARSLALGTDAHGAIWKVLLWIVAILAVFVPLSVWGYRNRSS